jgi:transcriptional regulator GlxA family with amidase domain
MVSVQPSFRTGTGMQIAADRVLSTRAHKPDVLVVLAMNVPSIAEIEAAVVRPDVARVIESVRRAAAAGVRVLASCSGTFVCAEAGILDGLPAATSWWLAPLFRARYPQVELLEDRMVVRAGQVVTAGAALSQIDLMLWLVRDVAGPQVAALCSRYLLIDERSSQARYALVDHLAHRDGAVARAEAYARRNLRRPIGASDLARAAKTSSRTLERRFHEALGMAPARYLRRLRAERAAHLLGTTSKSVVEVAEAVGYADSVSLWRLLRAELGATPSQLRKRSH